MLREDGSTNLTTFRILLNIKVIDRGQGHMGFFVFFACMILFEPVGRD